MNSVKRWGLSVIMVCGIAGGFLAHDQTVMADETNQPVVQTITAQNDLLGGNEEQSLSWSAIEEAKLAGQTGFYAGIDGYPINQCTGFVAAILQQQQVPASLYAYLGNGDQWGVNAASRGLRVDRQARPGAVVYFNYVHVGYVTQVHADGSFEMLEGNFDGQAIHERRVTLNDDVAGFIHFEPQTQTIVNG